MRRRLWGFALIVMSLVLVLAGCGKRDAGAVVKDLDKQVDKLESYTTTGTMTLNTGTEPQEYQVEVSYQKPSYYRISLSNEKKDISQIVLKNDDGVFVLTPHLNKSFRFQSDWPKNQGQVYLYESLVNSISKDQERQFTTDGDSYVFDVEANYSNAALARQKIWINKKSFAPQTVEIYDGQNKAIVVMNFNDFKFNESFEKDYFDMQRNMTSARIALPTLGLQDNASGKNAGEAKGSAQAGANDVKAGTAGGTAGAKAGTAGHEADGTKGVAGNSVTQGATGNGGGTQGVTGNGGKQATGNGGVQAAPAAEQVSLIEPGYTPDGVGKPSASETKLGDHPAILLKYSGTYNYTLLETKPTDKSASYQQGELVDLGYGFGVMTGTENKTLIWMYQGTEFRLSSGDLPKEDMIGIAISVQNQSSK